MLNYHRLVLEEAGRQILDIGGYGFSRRGCAAKGGIEYLPPGRNSGRAACPHAAARAEARTSVHGRAVVLDRRMVRRGVLDVPSSKNRGAGKPERFPARTQQRIVAPPRTSPKLN